MWVLVCKLLEEGCKNQSLASFGGKSSSNEMIPCSERML